MYEYSISLKLPTASAGADATADVAIATKSQLVAAHFAPDADSALDGTNYGVVTLEANDGAGGSFAAVSSAMTTETVAMAKGTRRDFALTRDSVPAGSIVRVAKTYEGTGVAVEGTVTLYLRGLA